MTTLSTIYIDIIDQPCIPLVSLGNPAYIRWHDGSDIHWHCSFSHLSDLHSHLSGHINSSRIYSGHLSTWKRNCCISSLEIKEENKNKGNKLRKKYKAIQTIQTCCVENQTENVKMLLEKTWMIGWLKLCKARGHQSCNPTKAKWYF